MHYVQPVKSRLPFWADFCRIVSYEECIAKGYIASVETIVEFTV